MKRFASLCLALLLLPLATFAADTAYAPGVNRRRQVALEWRVKLTNDALLAQTPPGVPITAAQEIQRYLDDYLDGQFAQLVSILQGTGITLAIGEIFPLPIVSGNLDIEAVETGDVCNVQLTGGSAPSKNFESRSRCSVTLGTVLRINVYWNALKDRYEIQNLLAVPVTLRLTRAK